MMTMSWLPARQQTAPLSPDMPWRLGEGQRAHTGAARKCGAGRCGAGGAPKTLNQGRGAIVGV